MKPVIYQLIVRLAGNSNTKTMPFGTMIENGCGKFNDLSLHFLRTLSSFGITHIWLTGIIEHSTCTDYTRFGIMADNPLVVKGIAGSPYAIKDYYDVCPDLACSVGNRMQEFEALIERCGKAGLKPVIDFVPNHVARQYYSDQIPAGIETLGQNDQKDLGFCPNNNFYYIPKQALCLPPEVFKLKYVKQINHAAFEENPAKVTGNDQFGPSPAFTDWYDTVKLNYGVDYLGGNATHFDPIPDTWIKMTDILHFWASKGVCGFRCDMAEMVPVEFWEYAISSLKEKYPEIIFIAEIYNPHAYRPYIEKGGFDYLYDKVGFYDTMREILCGGLPADGLTSVWQKLEGLDGYMLRFMENHDEQRIASRHFAGNPWSGIPAMAVAATMHQGPLLIYFGQELGEAALGTAGFSGNQGRTTIFDYYHVPTFSKWFNKGKCNTQLLSEEQNVLKNEYANILKLCSDQVINSGQFYDLMWYNHHLKTTGQNHVYAYLRWSPLGIYVIAVNFSTKQIDEINIKIPEHFGLMANIKSDQRFFLKTVAGNSPLPEALTFESITKTGLSVTLKPNYYVVICLLF